MLFNSVDCCLSCRTVCQQWQRTANFSTEFNSSLGDQNQRLEYKYQKVFIWSLAHLDKTQTNAASETQYIAKRNFKDFQQCLRYVAFALLYRIFIQEKSMDFNFGGDKMNKLLYILTASLLIFARKPKWKEEKKIRLKESINLVRTSVWTNKIYV